MLGFNQSRGPVDTHDKAPGDLGVERSRVSGLLDPEDPLEPSDDFVRRGVGRLVQVDHAGLDVGCELALERGAAGRDGSEVGGADEELVVVFEEEGPL